MRVQLAYKFNGHAPDDVVEVTDSIGRMLLREGRARVAPPPPRAAPAPEPPNRTYKPRTVFIETPVYPAERVE